MSVLKTFVPSQDNPLGSVEGLENESEIVEVNPECL